MATTNDQRLAVTLQRCKTLLEKTDLIRRFPATYTGLSRVLFDFEQQAKLSAAELRDGADEDGKIDDALTTIEQAFQSDDNDAWDALGVVKDHLRTSLVIDH